MKYDNFKQNFYIKTITTKEETKEIIKWISDNEIRCHITMATKTPMDEVAMIIYMKDEDHLAVFKSVWQPEVNQ